ncbi:MAG: inositol monophosphatase [Gammaproteobacteria bacterium]|nr:inositol monophosphatase [Gammaproteobacteria bacterium]
MKLSADDLRELSEYAIIAAQQAGQLIRSYAEKTIAVKQKSGGDSPASQVVTEVDLLSEQIIVKALTPTCERYDLALLTEESEDDKARLVKDHFWCVDPLDGTLAFIDSTPGYAVSIALVSQSGEPLIGVVYDPVTQILYSAVSGQGASRNGEPWELEKVMTDRPLSFVCDRGFVERPDFPKINEALTSLAIQHGYTGLKTIESTGAVMNACRVLENPPAIYCKRPKPQQGGGSLWDFAATAVIFHEIGAVASDVHGQPLDLNRAGSTFMNHRGILFATDKALARDIQGFLSG